MCKIYVINGKSILGKQEGNVVTGIYLQEGTDFSENVARYVLKKEAGELFNTIIGANDSYSERELVDTEIIAWKTVKLQYKTAEKNAEKELVKMVFNQLRGKK